MKFTKMQGCGNDYIYVNGFEEHVDNKPELVKRLSARHFGIGGDGVIFINPSEIADFEMEMYNADGSRSQMCGNGIRCVGKYVYDKGLTKSTQISVESFGKIKYLTLMTENNLVKNVCVDMGQPELIAANVPVISGNEKVIDEEIVIEDRMFHMTCVSMGNPHAVIFTDEITDGLVWHYGKLLETNERFPERTNVEFVKIIDENHVSMRVWERGTGETLACGTGCCATVVAAVLNGLTQDKVTVSVVGGEIEISWNRVKNSVFMSGPAETVFEGEISIL